MKTKYRFQVIDIRVHIDLINPKKIQLLRNIVQNRANARKARMFLRLIRHREVLMKSDRMKIVSANLI